MGAVPICKKTLASEKKLPAIAGKIVQYERALRLKISSNRLKDKTGISSSQNAPEWDYFEQLKTNNSLYLKIKFN